MASLDNYGANWTFEQDKLFETALVQFEEDCPNRWEKVANAVGGGKTAEEVKIHYEMLVEDIRRIEAGEIPLPNYKPMEEGGSKDKTKG